MKRRSNNQPATIWPARMASIVAICWNPVAKPRCLESTSSLLMPIFAGLKKTDCTASAKNPQSESGRFRSMTAPQIQASTSNCRMAVPIMTSRFEKRSLNQPAIGANNTNGSEIIRPAAVSTENPTAAPSGMRINCAILSLKAFWVC